MNGRFNGRLPRPAHGTVVAYLALFVALGGSAYAAATIGSSDIKPNAIKSRHIATGQVKTADVLDDGLAGTDIDEASLEQVPEAATVNGIEPGDLVRRGDSSATGLQGVLYYSYFASTTATNSYDFGQVELRTNSTAGQFTVCKPSGGDPFPAVIYNNGVRSTASVPASGCTAPFDAGVGGDFEVSVRRVKIFGVSSGDSIPNENYSIFGFGQI